MSDSLQSRVYRKLIEEAERNPLERAIWKATGNMFVAVNPREKAEEIAEVVREYLEEMRGGKETK